jgi:hypothetical protein
MAFEQRIFSALRYGERSCYIKLSDEYLLCGMLQESRKLSGKYMIRRLICASLMKYKIDNLMSNSRRMNSQGLLYF